MNNCVPFPNMSLSIPTFTQQHVTLQKSQEIGFYVACSSIPDRKLLDLRFQNIKILKFSSTSS